MRFYVVILDAAGDPRPNVKVTADFGIENGEATDYTDDAGQATIDTDGYFENVGIVVNNAAKGDYAVSDGETIKINI